MWSGMDTVVFFYRGVMAREKTACLFTSIGMINLTMVINSTNIIMKFDRDFRIMI